MTVKEHIIFLKKRFFRFLFVVFFLGMRFFLSLNREKFTAFFEPYFNKLRLNLFLIFWVFFFVWFPKMFCFTVFVRFGLWPIFLVHPFFKVYRSSFWRYQRKVKSFLNDRKDEVIFFFDYRYYPVMERLVKFLLSVLVYIFFLVVLISILFFLIFHCPVLDQFDRWLVQIFFSVE